MIQHTLFSPFIQKHLTDKKPSKLLEWIMIKYINNYDGHNLFVQ